jgi:hypothetical protein
MTEDFLSRAMREYERVRPCETMKPSLEARMEWLEADASEQRTAILRLERQVKHIRIGGAIVAAVAGWLLGRSFT